MMTPQEKVTFYRSQSDLALTPLDEARAAGDYFWCAENLEAAFESQLVAALVQWRHAFGDPLDDLGRTISIATETITILSSLNAQRRRLWWDFDFGPPCQLQFLLSSAIGDDLLSQLPFGEEALSAERDQIDYALDSALALALVEQQPLFALTPLLKTIAKDRRRSLLLETYANYRDLMASHDNEAEAARRVRVAEGLFRHRKKNSYYAGGAQTEGGGPDNDHVVDYHLAAVIKWCERKNPTLKIDSIHRWRW